MLSKTLANKIVEEVKKLFHEEIIITDLEGSIIAGTEKARVGTFHEGAIGCVKKNCNILISKDEEKHLKGVKAGLNLPIFFLNRVVGVIGITGEPEQTLPYGELLRKMTELLVQESYYYEETQWRTRRLEAFVMDWLEIKEVSIEFKERARIFDINLEERWQVILLQVDGNSDNLLRGLWQLQHLWNESFESDIFVPWSQKGYLIVHHVRYKHDKDLFNQKLLVIKSYIERTYQTSVAVGVGQAVETQNLSKGMDQAERALKAAYPKKGIKFEEQLRLELCLGEIGEATREEFNKRILQKLYANKELMDTVRMLFKENMSLKSTARKLHIHINTLHYRIKRVEEITRLDLRYVPDMVGLYLAFCFLDHYTNSDLIES